MALIKCSECGGQMSDKAIKCPHCGATNKAPQPNEPMVAQKKPKKKNSLLWIIIVAIVVLAGGCATWFFLSSNDNADKDAIVEITPQFTEAVHQYDELYPFHEGLAAVKKNGKYGFINTKGELVIPVQFYGVGGFSEGLALVYDDQYKASFIDRKGDAKITTDYDLRPGYINTSMGVENPYRDVEDLSFRNGVCGIIGTNPNDPCGYKWIDRNGNEVSEPTEQPTEVASEYTVFSKEREDGETFYGLKDSQGNEVVAPAYSYISEPSNGVVSARITEFAYFNNRSEQLDAMERGEDVVCSIYGYIDLNGVSTFQDGDYKKIEEFHRIQKNKAYEADRAERQRQRESEIEEYRRQQAQNTEWLYGTWTCHVVLNDPYLGRLESNDKLIITQSNLQKYSNGKLEYNGTYEIEDGQIKYDRTSGSALVIPIDYTNQRLEFGDGLYFSKSSSSPTSASTPTSGSYNAPKQVTFRCAADVYSYLSSHTFVSGSNKTLRISPSYVSLEGSPTTGAPRITNFGGSRADIEVKATSGQTYHFHLDASNNTITQAGRVFRAQ